MTTVEPMTLQRLTDAAPGDPATNTATVRTTVNTAAVMVVVFAISRITGQTVDTTDPLVLLAAPAVVGFAYRLSRYVSHRWPFLAHLLFGIGTAPTYKQ